ncbi:MAG: PilZ domain-containing protein [Acidobacteriota bacterium]
MTSHQDRRRSLRTPVAEAPALGSLRFRAGAPVEVIDLSGHGALIETERYLGPGTTLEMVFGLADASVPVRVRVAHSRVWRLQRGERPQYRVGLCFSVASVRLGVEAWVEPTHRATNVTRPGRPYPDRSRLSADAPWVASGPGSAGRVAWALEGSST